MEDNRPAVLVCGGRDFNDYDIVEQTLDMILNTTGIKRIIHGDSKGADRLAERYANEHDIPITAYPANWWTHGRAAGPIRNQLMLDTEKPDVIVAFPGGKGTKDMVQRVMKGQNPNEDGGTLLVKIDQISKEGVFFN